MALKTLQLPSSLTRPSGYSFSPCPSSPSYQPKLLTRVDAGAGAKKHQKRTTSVLKCRANLHGCMDEVVQTPKDQTTEIPIVMYPSVAFPGTTLQVQAFEFRHRIMMHTLLQQGLKFGVIYCDKNGRMADVGCIVHVIECERLSDDRFFLTCVGGDRFRVVDIVRTKPYVVASIKVLKEQPGSGPQDDLGSLMQQVEQHLQNVAMLSGKLNQKLKRNHQAKQLRRMHSAASFSFLVARLFIDDHMEQQTLLQMTDTTQRLAREGMYLERRSKYLAAIAAIKDAFEHLSCNGK
ncbi:unnamed protein product [Urochloa humidicola]